MDLDHDTCRENHLSRARASSFQAMTRIDDHARSAPRNASRREHVMCVPTGCHAPRLTGWQDCREERKAAAAVMCGHCGVCS